MEVDGLHPWRCDERTVSESDRIIAGDVGHVDSADAAVGTQARICAEPVDSDEFGRDSEGGYGLALSGAASDGKTEIDFGGMESFGDNQRTVYRLTVKGKKQLVSERSRWSQLSDAIAGVLNPAKNEGEA